ncbi:MAG TPA: biotin/lipoyl-containing protein [Ktedonobacteraceae bacterium]|nr:biotin/lipoyl-containing protein [Ktedonobacteraceae bacterium]
MDTHEQMVSWIERVEELIHILEGTSIGELELIEGGTEIIIRRQPGMALVALPEQANHAAPVASGGRVHAEKVDTSVAIAAPLTGVYYSASSPASPPFVSVGDIVQVGQIVALIEAMKVFNEVQAEISGRVVKLAAQNGEVVQKGSALIRVMPL